MNDLDYGTRILMVDPFVPLGAIPVAIEYDLCDGVQPTQADSRCGVEFAADTKAKILEGVTCSVEIP